MNAHDIRFALHGPKEAAIKLECNWLEICLESESLVGALIYVGRAAPRQKMAAYTGKRHSVRVYKSGLRNLHTRFCRG